MTKNTFRRTLIAASMVTLATAVTSCADLLDGDYLATDTKTTIDVNNDYYRVTGSAQRDYTPMYGHVDYCEPDELGRARCAVGELTAQTRQKAQARGRQNITGDPVGWNGNAEVHIPALPQVPGSTDYNGWMFNRSHLLADSLGGDPTMNNMVTGTRTQNVGSVNNSGGMAYTEAIARDYLDGVQGQDANACPLYYAATPNYSGDELLPRTVTIDIQSCDKDIDQRVIVDNTANGFDINHAIGGFTPKD